MPDLLLELFSEEIPARMQAKAADDLRRMVTDKLVAEGLVYEGAKAFVTPLSVAAITGERIYSDLFSLDDRTVVGYQELLDKHFATRYVLARESYVFKLLQLDYDTVLALSTDELGREYARQYEGPNARDKRLGPYGEIRIEVRSVTLARDAVGAKAVVRFEKTFRRGEGDPGRSETFVATMTFHYQPSMLGTERDLISNPLGFRVTTYRVDAELPSSSPSKSM